MFCSFRSNGAKFEPLIIHDPFSRVFSCLLAFDHFREAGLGGRRVRRPNLAGPLSTLPKFKVAKNSCHRSCQSWFHCQGPQKSMKSAWKKKACLLQMRACYMNCHCWALHVGSGKRQLCNLTSDKFICPKSIVFGPLNADRVSEEYTALSILTSTNKTEGRTTFFPLWKFLCGARENGLVKRTSAFILGGPGKCFLPCCMVL